MARNKTVERLGRAREHLQKGNFGAARKLLRETIHRPRRLSASERLEAATLSLAAAQRELAVAALYPSIYDERDRLRRELDSETVRIYGRALAELGSLDEAIRLLRQVDHSQSPAASLSLAYAYFRRWDWRTPIKWLEATFKHPGLTDAERIRAKFILGIAMVHGAHDYGRADELLEDVVRAKVRERLRPVHRNAGQMYAQSAWMAGDRAEAMRRLERAREQTRNEKDPVLDLTLDQWEAIIREDWPALKRVRKRAAGARLWEVLRSVEYYLAIGMKDRRRARKLYVGGTYPGVRARLIAAELIDPRNQPESHPLRIGRFDREGEALVFDPLHELKPGQLVQRTLRALAADFYRPPSTVELFARVFPGEHYHPASSRQRVWQALRRSRDWLEKRKIPLEIRPVGGRFELRSDRKIIVVVRSDAPNENDRIHQSVRLLEEHFGRNPFSAAEAESVLGLKRWSVVNVLKSACSAGLLERRGAGPGTRYRRAA